MGKFLVLLFVLTIFATQSSFSQSQSLTQIETSFDKITLANASQLQQLAVLGKGVINDIDWSENNASLAIATSAGIWVYDPSDFDESPRLIQTGSGYVEYVSSNAASDVLVSHSSYPDVGGGYSQFWNLESLVPTEAVDQVNMEFYQSIPVISPDGKIMFVDTKLVDVETGTERLIKIDSVSGYGGFSADSQILAVPLTLGRQGDQPLSAAVAIIDVTTGEQLALLSSKFLQISDLAFNQNGTYLLAAAYTLNEYLEPNHAYIWAWDIQSAIRTGTGQPSNDIALFQVKGEVIRELVFAPNADLVSMMISDNYFEKRTIRIFEAASGKLQHTLLDTEGIMFHPEDNQPVSYEVENETLILRNIATSEIIASLSGFKNWSQRPELAAYMPENWYYFNSSAQILTALANEESAAEDSIIERFDLRDDGFFSQFEISRDKKFVARLQPDQGIVTILDTQTGVEIATLPTLGEGRRGFHFSRDNTLLMIHNCYSGSGGQGEATVEIWNILRENLVKRLSPNILCEPVFSPNLDHLATTTNTEGIQIWDIANGTLVKSLVEPSVWSRVLDYNSDGKLLASGGYFGEMVLWDVNKGELINIFKGHTWDINHIQFIADDHFLITESGDGTARIWGVPQS